LLRSRPCTAALSSLAVAASIAAIVACTGDDPVFAPSTVDAAETDVVDASAAESGAESGAADGLSPLSTRVQIAVAESATCALRSSGSVWCWGTNRCGELGLGSLNDGEYAPIRAALPAPAVRIVAGTGHFCVLARDATVWCWGRNANGQLGHSPSNDTENPFCGTGFAFVHEATPKKVAGLDGVVEISSGRIHVCARKADGSVWCWGGDDTRQLGHDTSLDVGCGGGTTCDPNPTAVPGLVADGLGMGSFHSCALTKSGAVCWGDNNSDQLGHTGNDDVVVGGVTMNAVPKPAAGGADAIEVEGGDNFTCVMNAAKAVSCWGEDAFAQLGSRLDGGAVSTAQPVAVSLPPMVKTIGLGSNYACAASSGALTCWGNDEYGQAGPKGDGGAMTPPLDVPGAALGDVAQVAARTTHTCALTSSGSVLCWGRNDSGQLGHDPAMDTKSCGTGCSENATPTQVTNLP
jgi:alpha-tubulin suppressor-like RCC1 family protein